jgi:hypothetical protein
MLDGCAFYADYGSAKWHQQKGLPEGNNAGNKDFLRDFGENPNIRIRQTEILIQHLNY